MLQIKTPGQEAAKLAAGVRHLEPEGTDGLWPIARTGIIDRRGRDRHIFRITARRGAVVLKRNRGGRCRQGHYSQGDGGRLQNCSKHYKIFQT